MAELNSTKETERRNIFDTLIERRWGKPIVGARVNAPRDPNQDFEEYTDPDEDAQMTIDIEDTVDATGRQLNANPAYKVLLNAEVFLQRDNVAAHGQVTQRALGPDGEQRGQYDENPILNSIV